MKAVPNDGRFVCVVLSRRNLLSLLAKLDDHPKNSHCTIVGGSDAVGVMVSAQEDDVHYAEREPGAMEPSTEAHIRRAQSESFIRHTAQRSFPSASGQAGNDGYTEIQSTKEEGAP